MEICIYVIVYMMIIAMHTRHEAGHVNYTNAYKKADYGGDDRTKNNTGP